MTSDHIHYTLKFLIPSPGTLAWYEGRRGANILEGPVIWAESSVFYIGVNISRSRTVQSNSQTNNWLA